MFYVEALFLKASPSNQNTLLIDCLHMCMISITSYILFIVLIRGMTTIKMLIDSQAAKPHIYMYISVWLLFFSFWRSKRTSKRLIAEKDTRINKRASQITCICRLSSIPFRRFSLLFLFRRSIKAMCYYA